MNALVRVGEIRRVPLVIHWGVFAIVVLVVVSSGNKLASAIVAAMAYLSMLLIHELGHQWVATRLGCRVLSIELFPLHGRCRFETPKSDFDRSLIAWGGVAAQFLIGIPLAAFVVTRGYTHNQAVNAVLAILGFMSPAVGLLNLIPAGNLDGRVAWRLFTQLARRRSARETRRKRSGRLRAVE
jgi:Zn-dependent protease